jgi:hypothetical protein
VQEILPVLRDITLILHFIGWAAVFGAWFSQVKVMSSGGAKINNAMHHGIWLAFITGLVLVGFAEYRAATVVDFEVDHFKVAVKTLDAVVEETLQANGLQKSDLDWLIPHQANLRIISATAKRLEMSMDRVIVTVDRHGNTSAASVPLALDEAVRSGKVQRGELLLLEAFGGGFTWGSALIRY